jgi:NitT/TauT family transport system substrate-binding protein
MYLASSRKLARSAFLNRVATSAAAASLLSTATALGQGVTKLTTVRVAVTAGDGNTSVVYAKYAGLFEKAGLDVQLQITQNGAAVAAAIASGAFDMGNGGVTSIFLAHEKGIPFVFIAPAGMYDARAPYDGALVLKNSPLTLGKDIENEVVGTVALEGIGHDAMCAWISQHGGDPSTVRFIEVPYSAAPTALLQQRIVAAETITPAMTVALDSGNFRFVPILDSIGKLYLQSAWFTTRDFSAKNPDVVRTFAHVVAATAVYVNSHHAETAPITAQFTGIPLEVVQRMPRATQGLALSPELIQPAIETCAKFGSLKKAFPAQDIIDPLVTTLKLQG